MDILSIIALAAKVAQIALQVGQDALPFIEKIKQWASGEADPTQADWDWLKAAEAPLREALHDKSQDDPV